MRVIELLGTGIFLGFSNFYLPCVRVRVTRFLLAFLGIFCLIGQ